MAFRPGGLILPYRRFRDDLRGFAVVSFDDYRNRLVLLRRQLKPWSPEDVQYITRLAEEGGAYALQRFMGLKHRQAAKVLGDRELSPDPMTKDEVGAHMRNLVKNCLSAGWKSSTFTNFAKYLDSDMTPDQLAEKDREAEREARMKASFVDAAGLRREQAAEPPKGAVPTKDEFATQFRGASRAYKKVVVDCLAEAAQIAEVTAAIKEKERKNLLQPNHPIFPGQSWGSAITSSPVESPAATLSKSEWAGFPVEGATPGEPTVGAASVSEPPEITPEPLDIRWAEYPGHKLLERVEMTDVPDGYQCASCGMIWMTESGSREPCCASPRVEERLTTLRLDPALMELEHRLDANRKKEASQREQHIP